MNYKLLNVNQTLYFCFFFIIYRLQMLELGSFLIFCHCMLINNTNFVELLILCFRDLHWFNCGVKWFPNFVVWNENNCCELRLQKKPKYGMSHVSCSWVVVMENYNWKKLAMLKKDGYLNWNVFLIWVVDYLDCSWDGDTLKKVAAW